MSATAAPPAGLEGVVAAETAIGDVLGEEGRYHYRGLDAPALARDHSLEEVWHLLLHGRLPDEDERQRFVARVASARERLAREAAPALRPVLGGTGGPDDDAMARLRTAWSVVATVAGCRSWLDLDAPRRAEEALALAAVGPVLVAALHDPAVLDRLDDLPESTAATHLALVLGHEPDATAVRALERYLVLTLDHGLNASTFVARAVTSTGADLGAAIVAGLAALSGPLHGGAPSRALAMLDEIGEPDRAEAWVRAALGRGERIMGFGHRIYRTEDPRATLLRATAIELGGPRVALALAVEREVRRQLRERHPDRALDVNVEYHAAVVLEAVGLPPALFTPTFATARAIGWTAHALEQMEGNRIIRPASRYVGPATP